MRTATRYLEKRMRGDLARLTGGRYRRVAVDDATLDISVFAPERGAWVRLEELSQGTLDLGYLAARLGLVRLVTQDRRPPLVFDDPFVTFDDDRAERAIAMLRELAADFQVIYLTTSDRYDHAADRVVVLPGPTAVDDRRGRRAGGRRRRPADAAARRATRARRPPRGRRRPARRRLLGRRRLRRGDRGQAPAGLPGAPRRARSSGWSAPLAATRRSLGEPAPVAGRRGVGRRRGRLRVGRAWPASTAPSPTAGWGSSPRSPASSRPRSRSPSASPPAGLPAPVRLAGFGLAIVAILLVSIADDGTTGPRRDPPGARGGRRLRPLQHLRRAGRDGRLRAARGLPGHLVGCSCWRSCSPAGRRSGPRSGDGRGSSALVVLGRDPRPRRERHASSSRPRPGGLALAAVLGSLYPVSTVILAAVVLREPIGRIHAAGIAAAALAAILIVGGG